MRLRKNQFEGEPTAPAGTPGRAELTYLELGSAKVPIFSACTPDQLLHLARLTVLRDAAAREAVVTEGEPGDAFSKRAFREALEEAPFRENVFLGMARRLHQVDDRV